MAISQLGYLGFGVSKVEDWINFAPKQHAAADGNDNYLGK